MEPDRRACLGHGYLSVDQRFQEFSHVADEHDIGLPKKMSKEIETKCLTEVLRIKFIFLAVRSAFQLVLFLKGRLKKSISCQICAKCNLELIFF